MLSVIKRISATTLFFCFLTLAGCDVKNEPIPLTDSPLIGVWEGQKETKNKGLIQIQKMYLELKEPGYVALHQVNCWAEKNSEPLIWKVKDFQIDFMPIIKLTQKKIKAQWMPFTPKIELRLDRWPETENGVATMVVDGVTLQRVATPSDRSRWLCEDMLRKSDNDTDTGKQ